MPDVAGLGFVLATHGGHYRADAAGDSGVVIALLEGRRYLVANDTAGHEVGEGPLQAASRLDAHLALVFRHQQQRAVILSPLADLPLLHDLHGVLFQDLPLEARYGEHHDLGGVAQLEGSQLALQLLHHLRRQHRGVVVDVALQRRHLGGAADGSQEKE